MRGLLLLLACLPAAASVFSDAPQAGTSSRAAQFDAVFQEVIGPGSMDMTYDAYEADLQKLRILLPAGDRTREVQFRSVYCASERWKDLKQGLAYSDDAQRRARAAGDLASQARAQFCRIGYVLSLEGTRKALAEADRMVAMLANSQERQLYGEALVQRGGLLSQLGEQAKALLDYQRARASFREAGINHEVDALMLEMAIAYRRIGDWTQAERYFTRSVERVQDKQDWDRVITDLVQLGYLYDESGRPQKAKASFERAIAVARDHGEVLSEANARVGLASAQVTLGEHDAALATLAQARAGFEAKQSHGSDDMLLLLTGQALAGKGEHRQAMVRYAQAQPLIEQDGNQRYLALLYEARAASEEALGQTAQALADFKRYTALQTSLQGKMRLEQSRLLEYEYEIRRREFENHRLRAEATARQSQVKALERVRRWQTLALLLGVLLMTLLAALAWRQRRRTHRLRTLAMTDPMTGAASRVAIERIAARTLAESAQTATPVAVLLLDLDYFKQINDRYGHAAGDTVLRATVEAWQAQLRDRDALGRIGGEEFAVVCAGTGPEQARAIAARLLEATRLLRLPEIDRALRVSTSIGIAAAQPDDTRETLFARADAALYRAKQQGRDRVEE
ncbi:MAG TPA: diguanylate cyclase [Thermomonas sp.]